MSQQTIDPSAHLLEHSTLFFPHPANVAEGVKPDFLWIFIHFHSCSQFGSMSYRTHTHRSCVESMCCSAAVVSPQSVLKESGRGKKEEEKHLEGDKGQSAYLWVQTVKKKKKKKVKPASCEDPDAFKWMFVNNAKLNFHTLMTTATQVCF